MSLKIFFFQKFFWLCGGGAVWSGLEDERTRRKMWTFYFTAVSLLLCHRFCPELHPLRQGASLWFKYSRNMLKNIFNHYFHCLICFSLPSPPQLPLHNVFMNPISKFGSCWSKCKYPICQINTFLQFLIIFGFFYFLTHQMTSKLKFDLICSTFFGGARDIQFHKFFCLSTPWTLNFQFNSFCVVFSELVGHRKKL